MDTLCKDFLIRSCNRSNCRFSHKTPTYNQRKKLMIFCHDFQNRGCVRPNCKFLHCSIEDEEEFYKTGILPLKLLCKDFAKGNCWHKNCAYYHPTKETRTVWKQEESGPLAKVMRITQPQGLSQDIDPEKLLCHNCVSANKTIQLLHDNISAVLKRVADLTQKNMQLTAMNELLLDQTASLRGFTRDQTISSSVATATPTALATVSVAPVVSLAGLVPPAQGLITVSSAAQLVGGSGGTLIVTSAGAPQLMAASSSATLVRGAQAVVIAPQQQHIVQNISAAEAQLVQQATSHQITISSPAQGLTNSQSSTVTYPITKFESLPQNILPH